MLENSEYVIEFRGMKIGVPTVEKVVETVRALEREVPVPTRTDVEVPVPSAPRREFAASGDALTTAIYGMFREEPRARRPVEIVRALRKRRELRGDATYQRVYGVLRHGDFEKRAGKWVLRGGV
jgi:hypothetical protein